VPPPSPTTQNTERGGVWAEQLRWAAPESVAHGVALFGGVYVLVPIWLQVGRAASGLAA
jgi:hypothetical protein